MCFLFSLVVRMLPVRYHVALWLSYVLTVAFCPIGVMTGTALREKDYRDLRARATRVAEEIVKFSNSNGRYPRSLSELGAETLSGVRDLVAAGKIQYIPASSGYPRLQYETWDGWLFYDFRNCRWQSD
jgi:hypothetical protein